MEAQRSDKPIVVGVDGSRFSRAALDWALAEAANRGCSVRALMVWHAAPPMAAGRPSTVGLGTQSPGEPDNGPMRTLDQLVTEAAAAHEGVRVDAEVVRGGAPEVLAGASADAQLLVLGSHGHGQLFQAALGSVSQHCVRHAACPVVVLPASLAPAPEPEAISAEATPQPLSYGPGPLL